MRPFGVIPKPFRMEGHFEWKVITTGQLFRNESLSVRKQSERKASRVVKITPLSNPLRGFRRRRRKLCPFTQLLTKVSTEAVVIGSDFALNDTLRRHTSAKLALSRTLRGILYVKSKNSRVARRGRLKEKQLNYTPRMIWCPISL